MTVHEMLLQQQLYEYMYACKMLHAGMGSRNEDVAQGITFGSSDSDMFSIGLPLSDSGTFDNEDAGCFLELGWLQDE